MAKAAIDTGQTGQPVHTRTSSDTTKSQVVVLGTDDSDAVVDPATLATTARQDIANTSLAALLVELGQKLEPGDLAALSTAAKQDLAKTALDNILGELGQKLEAGDLATLATAAKQDLAKTTLDAIAASLVTIDTSTNQLEGYTDGLEGFVDGVESALAALATQNSLADLLTRTGEVQATPTANTILARLKAIEDKVSIKTPLGYRQGTISTTAQTLTTICTTIPSGANFALIVVTGIGVRYRPDGTNPTASIGMPINPLGVIEFDGDPTALRFITVEAGTATLDCDFYRVGV